MLNMVGSVRRRVRAAALALVFATAPALAGGGTGDKGTDMALDLLILRPLGLLVTGLGSVALVVSLPFTLPSGSVGVAACELVREPLAYTFTRPLGDVEGSAKQCPDESTP
jgi:hypothetical protein